MLSYAINYLEILSGHRHQSRGFIEINRFLLLRPPPPLDENNLKLTWAHPKHEIELSRWIFFLASRLLIGSDHYQILILFGSRARLTCRLECPTRKTIKKCWPKTLRNAIISRCFFIAKRRETERHEKCVWRQEDGLTAMMFHFLGGMILTSKNHHEIE